MSCVFVFKQKTAYEWRISDWSSDVCSSDLIPVNGPIGQLAYLSRLETQSGQRILFHRLGAIDKVDVFEAVTFDGSGWFIFFVDLYHPRRSRLTPDGFRFTKDVAQFSGFHKFCENFPYDFVEKKASDRKSTRLNSSH